MPADLEKWTDLRFVSLKQLEAEIAAARAAGKPLPDAVRYMAGLQRVRYVLVYPDKQDIVLAGPAEGWKVDSLGSVVGATSNRPVLTLDDLMVALRVAESSNTQRHQLLDRPDAGRPAAVCSRSPANFSSNPQVASRQMEEAVGPQTITVTGIPATSHFARVIVAADFRMKRLAMNMEPAPVDGMPSFLTMIKRGGAQNMMPRFWLAPKYEPLRRDNDGLAWEIRGQARPLPHRAGLPEQRRPETALRQSRPHRPEMGRHVHRKVRRTGPRRFQLRPTPQRDGPRRRRCTPERKNDCTEKSGFQAPNLMSEQPLDEYPAPRSVPSQASFVKAGRNWVVSVSGGVQIFPWQVADRTEVSKDLASTRQAHPAAKSWYWQK